MNFKTEFWLRSRYFLKYCNIFDFSSYDCKNNIMATELRTYRDSINEITVKFRSDAPQSTINALEFNGEWYIVCEILRDWGYIVIESPSIN